MTKTATQASGLSISSQCRLSARDHEIDRLQGGRGRRFGLLIQPVKKERRLMDSSIAKLAKFLTGVYCYRQIHSRLMPILKLGCSMSPWPVCSIFSPTGRGPMLRLWDWDSLLMLTTTAGQHSNRSRSTIDGRRLALFACSSLFLIVGCGGSEYPLAPVSGRLTMDGQPLHGININFQPVAKDPKNNPLSGPGSYARTDADGRYALKTVIPVDLEGAVVGKHVVRMIVPKGGDFEKDDDLPSELPKITLPKHAMDGSLYFEVPAEGSDAANFDL